MILVHQSPTTLVRDHGHHPNLGVLSSPRRVYVDAPEAGYAWAADNDAYNKAYTDEKFVTMLDKIHGLDGCLFVVCPDAVGDAEATLELFHWWLPRVEECDQPVAFVVQDGVENHPVPYHLIDAVFIGGTTEFKMGPVAAEIAREARRRGKHLHMGRVNTRRRIRYARSLGCDTIDGTNFSMFRRTHLPWALTWASSEQLWDPA